MRPVGVTAIAILTWLRASFYALGGLMLIGVGHLSARLVSAIATDSFLGATGFPGWEDARGSGARHCFRFCYRWLWSLATEELGQGRDALCWLAIWLLSALLGVARYPTAFHIVRVLVDIAILVYLLLPKCQTAVCFRLKGRGC